MDPGQMVNNSSLIEQQYNWLVKNGQQDNGVINEQEFESKSREDTHGYEV